MADGRAFCIDLLCGRGTDSAALAALHGSDALADACEAEGVVSQAHARLSEWAGPTAAPPAAAQSLAERARRCAVRSLLCRSEAERIQRALDAAGIPAIWLKGVALGQWLYASPHLRDVADIDLLLPDHATTMRASEVLAPLGYALPNPHIAGDMVVHEVLAWSARARLELDLHWDLSNNALFAGRVGWERLWIDSIPLPGLGASARGLSAQHALLHACMHRANNALTKREDRLRWLQDIHLLAGLLDDRDWSAWSEAAIVAGIADPCLEALRASARVFATPLPGEITLTLSQAAVRESVRTERLGSWTYLQVATWRRLPGMRARFRWLRQLVIPDLAHLRVRYGRDGAGALRLVGRRVLDGWRRWRGYAGR